MPGLNFDLTQFLTLLTSAFDTFMKSDLVKQLTEQFIASLPSLKEKLPLVIEYTKELFS